MNATSLPVPVLCLQVETGKCVIDINVSKIRALSVRCPIEIGHVVFGMREKSKRPTRFHSDPATTSLRLLRKFCIVRTALCLNTRASAYILKELIIGGFRRLKMRVTVICKLQIWSHFLT